MYLIKNVENYFLCFMCTLEVMWVYNVLWYFVLIYGYEQCFFVIMRFVLLLFIHDVLIYGSWFIVHGWFNCLILILLIYDKGINIPTLSHWTIGFLWCQKEENFNKWCIIYKRIYTYIKEELGKVIFYTSILAYTQREVIFIHFLLLVCHHQKREIKNRMVHNYLVLMITKQIMKHTNCLCELFLQN